MPSCLQLTVRHDRCITRASLPVNGSKFSLVAAWTDIPKIPYQVTDDRTSVPAALV